MYKIPEITSDLVKSKLARKLRQYVGRNMDFEYGEAARLLDVDQRTLESHVRGERAPGLEMFIRYAMLPEAGPAIAAELLSLAGLSVQPTIEGNGCVFHMNAELAGALRELADMLADGRVDHTEDPVWQAKALDLAMKLIGHVNARRKGGAA